MMEKLTDIYAGKTIDRIEEGHADEDGYGYLEIIFTDGTTMSLSPQTDIYEKTWIELT
jgi:hypothetical protein